MIKRTKKKKLSKEYTDKGSNGQSSNSVYNISV